MTATIFNGKLSVADPDQATPSLVDVSSEVTKCVLTVQREDQQVPATLSTPKSHGAGSRKAQIEIGYLSTDGSDGALFPLLWAAASGTGSKTLYFEYKVKDTATSSSNPLYWGTFVVSGADLGGDIGSLSEASITCTLTELPSVAYA